MAQLPIDEAITRFKENEDRLDIFTNQNGTYTTNEITPRQVETLPSLMDRLKSRYLNILARGEWNTGIAYSINDVITKSGFVYLCTEPHTSGVWAADLAANKFVLYSAIDSSVHTYLPDGTGAVISDVQSKLQERISVFDFMTDTQKDAAQAGSGLIDVTAAIQAALTYAGIIGGGTVELIGGATYLLSTKTTVSGETYFLCVPNNVKITGPRSAVIKVDANVGDYTGVFMSAVSPGQTASNVQFDGFTIDQNAQNNTTGNITPGNLANVHAAIYFNRTCKSTYVTNMAFLNAPGVNTVQFSGQNSFNVKVDNNKFEFLAGTSTTTDYDNSLVYITANGFSCSGNWCMNTSSVAGKYNSGVTALELHGANGVVTANNVYKFQNGFNIVGFTSTQTIAEYNNITVSENTVVGCRNGIFLWALTGSSLRGVKVFANQISLDDTLFNDIASVSSGVSFLSSASITGNFAAIDISNNTIEWLNDIESATISNSSAALVVEAYGAVRDVTVVGNRVINSPFNGISIFQRSGTFDRIDVNENYVENAGRNSLSAVRYGQIWRGVITNSNCLDNVCTDTTATPTALNAIYMPLLAAGSSVLARGNVALSPNSSTPLANRYGVYVKADDAHAAAVSGSNRILNTQTGADNYIVDISVTTGITLTAITSLYPQPTGQTITVQINNTSGGTTAISFAAVMVLASAFVQLTAGQRAYMSFTFDGATAKWYQSSPQMIVTS